MSERQHCEWGPSSLERLDKCPGSLRQCEGLADFETEDASRGTRIHALSAKLILGGRADEGDDPGEMETAMKIADFAQSEILYGETPEVHVETRLEYSSTPGDTLYWGTSDMVLVCSDCVKVYDWKTGFKPVEKAESNLQGAAYALAAMQRFGRRVAVVTFFNPCINQLTSFTFSDPPALASEIGRVIAAAKADNAPCVPGEAQCRYCKAAHAGTCPAHIATCEAVCNMADSEERQPLLKWSDAALAVWLERLQLAARLHDEVKSEMIRRCQQSGECFGYEVKEQSGGREARDIKAAFQCLAGYMEQDDFLSCCDYSVSKGEKLFADIATKAGISKTKKEAAQLYKELLAGCLQDKPARVCLVRKETAK